MVKRGRDLVRIVTLTTAVGLAAGIGEQKAQEHFQNFFNYLGDTNLIYDYWLLFWGGLSAFCHYLTRSEKNNFERAVDTTMTSGCILTLQDVGYWVSAARKVDLSWLGKYFGKAGEFLAQDVNGFPSAYVLAGAGCAAYLGRSVLRCMGTHQDELPLEGYLDKQKDIS